MLKRVRPSSVPDETSPAAQHNNQTTNGYIHKKPRGSRSSPTTLASFASVSFCSFTFIRSIFQHGKSKTASGTTDSDRGDRLADTVAVIGRLRTRQYSIYGGGAVASFFPGKVNTIMHSFIHMVPYHATATLVLNPPSPFFETTHRLNSKCQSSS